jgi:hypothetical protein
MATLTASFHGGQALRARLADIARGAADARRLRVGFLEGAKYPQGDGGRRIMQAARRARQMGRADWHRLLMRWSFWQRSHPRDLHVAQVAFWQEFGTARTPARPFMRTTISQHSPQWGEHFARYWQERGSARHALRLLGVEIRDQIVQMIYSWHTPPNAPLTQLIKGFDTPLRDTAVLVRAVDFEVS